MQTMDVILSDYARVKGKLNTTLDAWSNAAKAGRENISAFKSDMKDYDIEIKMK